MDRTSSNAPSRGISHSADEPGPTSTRRPWAVISVSVARRRPLGRRELERRGEDGAQLVVRHAHIDAMDRLDAELVGDELADEGQGLLGRRVVAAGGGAHVVAMDPTDAVAVMAVGDEDVIAGDPCPDGGESLRVGHSLDDMLDAVDLDRSDRVRWLCEQGGRDSPPGTGPRRATGWRPSPGSDRADPSRPWASCARGGARRRHRRRRPPDRRARRRDLGGHPTRR